MANVTLNIVLGTINKSLPGLQATENKIQSMKKDVGEFREKWEGVMQASQQAGAVLTGAAVGMGLIGKSAISASMEMENYRAKLQVAMKDSAKAEEMLGWAKTFAAKTPFEMSGVVDATTRLQLYGLEAQHWLPLIGDMAGAMGKDVTQGVEAIADAVSGGGLERLKEFGISSTKLKDAGWTGSYQDAEGINSLKVALETIMARDFGGGMAKMMGTATGAMSNFKDSIFQLRVAVGDVLLPALTSITRVLTTVVGIVSEAAAEHPMLTKAVVTVAAAFGILAGTLGPILFVLPNVIEGWKALSAILSWTAIKARAAGAANLFSAAATKVAGWWAAFSSIQWNALTWAQVRQAIAARASAVASGTAGLGAKLAGVWAAISAVGWGGLTAAIWRGVAAAWAFVASPLGLTLVAAAGALLLVVRACRMGAEAWRAWHEAKEGKKSTQKMKDTAKQAGYVTYDEVAKDLGLEKGYNAGTLSPADNARLQAEVLKRQRAARANTSYQKGNPEGWRGPQAATQNTAGSTDPMQAEIDKMKADLARSGGASMPAIKMPAMEAAGADLSAAAIKQTSAAERQTESAGAIQAAVEKLSAPAATPAAAPTSAVAQAAARWQKRTDAEGNVVWTQLGMVNGLLRGVRDVIQSAASAGNATNTLRHRNLSNSALSKDVKGVVLTNSNNVTNHITVYAGAGANGQEIGKQVAVELRKVNNAGRYSWQASRG